MQESRQTAETARVEAAAEYLSFTLGSETYGIDILKVQEIRGYDSVTRIARSPEFVKGVINLRGVIVPILDLRIKFQVGEATYHQFTVVIIIKAGGKVVGMVVDGVSDVVGLLPAEIRPAPELAAVDTRYITGLATVDGQMLILVDIERLLSDELQLLAETQGQ